MVFGSAQTEELIMARIKLNFPEAMLKLQETLRQQNYTVSRVQRVDIGLTNSGYSTDKYRLVFFSTEKQIAEISQKFPHLIPYIPLKIAIFAEQEDTLLMTTNPLFLKHKDYPAAASYLVKWKKDIDIIFRLMRKDE